MPKLYASRFCLLFPAVPERQHGASEQPSFESIRVQAGTFLFSGDKEVFREPVPYSCIRRSCGMTTLDGHLIRFTKERISDQSHCLETRSRELEHCCELYARLSSYKMMMLAFSAMDS
ncbi:hypothetical protein RvY_14381-2 [Ramazzottius varieornatus]|nr:hypothetical protein RvY_14381-2 [Ramazzottius varieornatus]